MRIAGLDPGKLRDAFALCVCEIAPDRQHLLVKGAKRWMGRDYLEVEQEIDRIHRQKPFNRLMLEINNTGTHVYEILRNQYHLPVLPVTTVREIKDVEKKYNLERMDKNETVGTALYWNQNGIILFPEKSTNELDELKRQLSIFAEIKTEAGSISYRAEGQEHDDLVMALMLCVHYAKTIIRIGGGKGTVVGYSSDADYWQSLKSPQERVMENVQRRIKDKLTGANITDVRIV